jgi:hypothetical protein
MHIEVNLDIFLIFKAANNFAGDTRICLGNVYASLGVHCTPHLQSVGSIDHHRKIRGKIFCYVETRNHWQPFRHYRIKQQYDKQINCNRIRSLYVVICSLSSAETTPFCVPKQQICGYDYF